MRITKKGVVHFTAPVLFTAGARMAVDRSYVWDKEFVETILSEHKRLGHDEFDRQLTVIGQFIALVKE